MGTSKYRRSLEERLDAPAEGWKPEVGEKLIGTIIDLDERDSQYDEEPYTLVTVLNDEGEERAFHGFHTVPRRKLARLGPQIGDRIGIAYHGRHSKGYERYVIKLDRPPRTSAPTEPTATAETEPAADNDMEAEEEIDPAEGDIPF